MLEDAYRGERATPAIQRVIGQKTRCLLDDRDETFPYPLHHLLDRLVGQQSVLAYRYIHLLYPFLSVSESRGTDILAFSPLLNQRPGKGVLRSSAVRSLVCEARHRSRRCSRRNVDGSGKGPKRYRRQGQGGPLRGLDSARRLLHRYGRRLDQVRLRGIPAAGAHADQVHARRATAARILAAARVGDRSRAPW